MTGIVCLWSGAVIDIPEGWHLCDGTEGTPDLRGRFIVGAGDAYLPDDTGGSETHDHTVNCGTHAHDLESGTEIPDSSPAGNFAHATSTSLVTGTAATENHLPPYYALCYIMKL